MVPTIDSKIGNEYVTNIPAAVVECPATAISQRDPNQLYVGVGQHSVEEVVESWDSSVLDQLKRDCIHGTTEEPCDISRVHWHTKNSLGAYVVFHEAFAIHSGIGEFRPKE